MEYVVYDSAKKVVYKISTEAEEFFDQISSMIKNGQDTTFAKYDRTLDDDWENIYTMRFVKNSEVIIFIDKKNNIIKATEELRTHYLYKKNLVPSIVSVFIIILIFITIKEKIKKLIRKLMLKLSYYI